MPEDALTHRRVAVPEPSPRADSRYKWVAPSNTTVGVLLATIDSSIMLIAMPEGLHEAFISAIAACLVAAVASWSRGTRYVNSDAGLEVAGWR